MQNPNAFSYKNKIGQNTFCSRSLTVFLLFWDREIVATGRVRQVVYRRVYYIRTKLRETVEWSL